MENSKKSLQNSASVNPKARNDSDDTFPHALSFQLSQFLINHLPVSHSRPKLLLALSGGLDSTVLLHLLSEASGTVPFELHAMHVHHGLSPNADEWTAFCKQQCQLLNVPLQVVHVNVARSADDKNNWQGIEAEARQLRYNALFDYKFDAQPADFVVTAHHQDDQAETLLLQLFRGAGVKGLSSMAAIDVERRLLRPLLSVSRQSLQAYAVQQHLHWCDDESNANTQYERNFVRHEVVPVLESRFPSVKSVLARTAVHMAEALELLEALASQDSRELLANNSLCLQGLSQMTLARAKNVLRWWFAKNHLVMPTADHLNEIIGQLLYAKKDADLSIQLQHLTLKRYQQRAYLIADTPAEPFDLVWNGEPELMLPNGDRLCFQEVTGSGLALKIGITRLRIRNRDGGERFKPDAQRPTRTLKHLLQESHMPPWQRSHLPLIYWEDTLAYVPDIGIACELQATGDEVGLKIIWQRAA